MTTVAKPLLRVRKTEVKRAFVTPWVPFTPIMGILISFYMMYSLQTATWIRLVVWLVIGLLINLFSAVYVSRTIFMWELSRKRVESLSI